MKLNTKRDRDNFIKRMQTLYGDDFDPIMQMAENAMKVQAAAVASGKEADYIDANKEWERISQFTTPKLKSVEMVGADGFIEVHVHRKGD